MVSRINPLVSIIIPAYNADKTILRAVNSCLAQTYVNLEVIVIDNRSDDTTAEIVKRIQDSRVKYYYSLIKGRSLARNIGLDKAKGEYIQFLDADDELLPTKIEKAVGHLQSDLELKAHVCGVKFIKMEQVVTTNFPKLNYPKELLGHNIFQIQSVLFRKTTTNRFAEDMEYCEDWLFWVQELYDQKVYFESQYVGAIVHIHEGNTMGQTEVMNEYQLFTQQKIKKMYPINSSKLLLNEIKLLVIHYFTKEKEIITIETIQKHSKWRYKFLSVIVSLPFIHRSIEKRVTRLMDKNLY